MLNLLIRFCVFLYTLSILSACSSIQSIEHRVNKNLSLIKNSNFELQKHSFDEFDLISASSNRNTQLLSIYIEGDGLAWISRYNISSNPTPINPVALKLAIIDKERFDHSIAYIGRPCQYISQYSNNKCNSKFWSSHRFSQDVVANFNKVIDILKIDARAEKIQLIGFSGGAAISSILAATRNDIHSLVTVAGNLDHVSINKFNKVSQLIHSLNAIDYSSKLKDIAQHHIIGNDDDLIPESVVNNFIEKQQGHCSKKIVAQRVSHAYGWERFWKNSYKFKFDRCLK